MDDPWRVIGEVARFPEVEYPEAVLPVLRILSDVIQGIGTKAAHRLTDHGLTLSPQDLRSGFHRVHMAEKHVAAESIDMFFRGIRASIDAVDEDRVANLIRLSFGIAPDHFESPLLQSQSDLHVQYPL